MTEVSTVRLLLLRAIYALIAVGLAVTRWPELLDRPAGTPHMDSVVGSMLVAVSLLAIVGIVQPVKMLPLLFFELLWKSMWVLLWGIPELTGEGLDPAQEDTLIACLIGIMLVPLVMPWGYVLNRYVKAPGDRWGWGTPGQADPASPATTRPRSYG